MTKWDIKHVKVGQCYSTEFQQLSTRLENVLIV